ncbi:MAG: MOSC domain-containing protein [Planctomycetota bacterium]
MADSTPSGLDELLHDVPLVGRVEWIGIAAVRRAAMEVRAEVRAQPGQGIEGDHHGSRGGKRQVTLLQAEHLPVVGSLLGRGPADPARLRRNLVIAGINVYALRNHRLRVGEVLLEGTGPCPPCRRMNATLGDGGYHAMRGHGGITAAVLEGGWIRVGDPVRLERK